MAATQPLVQVPLPQMLRDFFLPLSLEFSSLLFLQLAHCHLYAVVRRSRCCSQAEAVLRAKFGRGTQLAGSPRWSIYLKDCCLHTCCSRIRCLTASPHRSCAPLGQAITWLTAHGKEETEKRGTTIDPRSPRPHRVWARRLLPLPLPPAAMTFNSTESRTVIMVPCTGVAQCHGRRCSRAATPQAAAICSGDLQHMGIQPKPQKRDHEHKSQREPQELCTHRWRRRAAGCPRAVMRLLGWRCWRRWPSTTPPVSARHRAPPQTCRSRWAALLGFRVSLRSIDTTSCTESVFSCSTLWSTEPA